MPRRRSAGSTMCPSLITVVACPSKIHAALALTAISRFTPTFTATRGTAPLMPLFVHFCLMSLEDPCSPGTDGDQPVYPHVHRDEGDGSDHPANDRRIIADHRVLYHVGQQEDHDEVTRVQTRQAPLAGEPE